MKHLLFVLFVVVNRVYGDTHAFDDHEINLEESIAEHTHPYVGLPVGTWRITDLNQSRREEVCLNQHSFCVGKCNNQVNKNYCNVSTMAWICLCQNQVPDVPPYHWPVTLAECQGKEQSCMSNCSYGSTKGICIKACGRYYKCDEAGSPVSGLKVEREDQTPTYGSASSSSLSSYYYCPSKYTIMVMIYFFVFYFICSYM